MAEAWVGAGRTLRLLHRSRGVDGDAPSQDSPDEVLDCLVFGQPAGMEGEEEEGEGNEREEKGEGKKKTRKKEKERHNPAQELIVDFC